MQSEALHRCLELQVFKGLPGEAALTARAAGTAVRTGAKRPQHHRIFAALADTKTPQLQIALACVFVFALLPVNLHAGGVVTNCTEAALRSAMAGGGLVTFACNGVISLSATITNDVNTTLDGTGQQVTLSGGGTVPVLSVKSGTSFTLANLTIANGHGLFGGGVYNGGTLTLVGATISNNSVVNAPWAPPDPAQAAQGGWGGGVYNAGSLYATNSQFISNTGVQRTDWDSVTYPVNSSLYVFAPCLGGAVYNGWQATFSNCLFSANGAYAGNGYRTYDISLGYQTLASGGRQGAGGAIYSAGSLTVSGCIFTSNCAQSGGAAWWTAPGQSKPGVAGTEADGGAIYATGTSDISTSTFIANTVIGGLGGTGQGDYAGHGGAPGGLGGAGTGGALFTSGTGSFSACTIVLNLAKGGQGGGGGGGMTIPGPFVIGTSGGSGGIGGAGTGSAVFAAGRLSLVNCTVASNSVSGGKGGTGGGGGYGTQPGGSGGSGGGGGYGAGALNDTNGALALTNCTIALNPATGGAGGSGGSPGGPGGGYGQTGTNGLAGSGGFVSAGAILINCIVATNTPANCSGRLTDAGHNLSSDGACLFTNIGSVNGIAPQLGALANYGGSTLTITLLPGSPAIDTADSAAAPATDQRGFPRSVGSAPDVGAFEFGSPPVALSVTRFGGGTIEFLGTGATNQSCRLFGSVDLSHWTPLATNQFGVDGQVVFQDTFNSATGERFYRLVLP